MGDFTLAIFPADTLATSITTTVWVGVWVVVFFNLRLGWLLSGLVVPGYLVPLLIAKPASAFVVVAEAALTYLIVWLLSEAGSRQPYWSSLFGRDRFFALVLVSVLVRVVMDGWLLPEIGPRLAELCGWQLDYRNHLHSYGLIIVSLIANYFWKPGLVRGLIPLGMTVGITYAIVRLVLIEWTNFNVGSLQYMYEDIASSLLASPKSYVILLTTAFIASWMNLRYSWDYNGILVPALLALQWHDPYKILASFVEAGVILLLAKAVLKLPIWRRTTVEGGRKILLFFNLAFFYRLALGFAVPLLWPTVKVTDLYGFGYLLSTLLALRAYEKNMAIRVTRASLQVSLVGAVAGSGVGYLLTFLPGGWLLPESTASPAPTTAVVLPGENLSQILRNDKLALYRQRIPNSFVVPNSRDLEQWSEALRRLKRYRDQGDPAELASAGNLLAAVNYSIHIVQERYLYLREHAPPRGWGMFVIDLENPDGALFEVPAPLDEWSTIEAGLCLFHRLGGGALSIAGTGRRTNDDGSADVLSNAQTMFGVFHHALQRGNVLQVRGQTRQHERVLARATGGRSVAPLPSSIWIKGAIPRGVDLRELSRLIPGWQLHWQVTPLANVLRDSTRGGCAELLLSRPDRRALTAVLVSTSSRQGAGEPFSLLDMPIGEWLLQRRADVVDRGSNAYVPASLEELLYLDEQVLKPLLRIAARAARFSDMTAEDVEELQATATAAALFDYRLVVLRDAGHEEDFSALVEDAHEQRRAWGTYVFRCGLAGPHVIEVPRPLYERNALEFGVALFDRFPASALLIAGAHPHANLDGSADVNRLSNKVSMFNLTHQMFLRELGPRPTLITQIRAIRAPVEADVVVALGDGVPRGDRLPRLPAELVQVLAQDGLHTRFVDGSPATAGYELGANVQLASLAQTRNKQLVGLWLSPSLRLSYRQNGEDDAQAAAFQTLGIASVTADLHDYLVGLQSDGPQYAPPPAVRQALLQFTRSGDIVSLRSLQANWPDLRYLRLIDRRSRQAFLLIDRQDAGDLPAVARLSEPHQDGPAQSIRVGLDRQAVQKYVRARAVWMEVRGEP